jgi:hypothetical protein
MSKAYSICIEEITAEGEQVFMSCTILPYGEQGLGIEDGGVISWKCWGWPCLGFALHGQPVIARKPDGPEAIIQRAGRDLKVPKNDVMPILNGDILLFSDRIFRIHLHGETDEVNPPKRVYPEGANPPAPEPKPEPQAEPAAGGPPPPAVPLPPKTPVPPKPSPYPEPKSPESEYDDSPLGPGSDDVVSPGPPPEPLPPPPLPDQEVTPAPLREGEDVPIGERIPVGTVTPAPIRFPEPRSKVWLVLLIIAILAAAGWAVWKYML